MISIFGNEPELETVSPAFGGRKTEQAVTAQSPSIVRNATSGYGSNNRFFRQARQIYDRAIVTERLAEQQTA